MTLAPSTRLGPWLERSYELHDSGIALLKVTWALKNLHSDPRWPRFLEKVGLEN